MLLQKPAFTHFPLGAVSPRGWLRSQLQLQADGLTGHLDEYWPSVRDSRWIGGECEGWERGPYWLDGLTPLAFLLEDEHLKSKASRWVETILAEQHPDGWLGAKEDTHQGEGLSALDPWPLFVLFKAFLQWHEATSDERIVPSLLACARRIQILLEAEPLRSWAMIRWADFVWCLHRLYELTGEEWLLDLAATAHEQGYDWRAHFEDLPCKTKVHHDQLGPDVGLPLHGVNNAMGLKSGAVWWRQSGDSIDKSNTAFGLAELDKYHGAASGMFNADEHLAGKSPSQGFETCAIVEEMFTLEVAGSLTGDAMLFDRLEQIAFNALPGSTTPDFWAHQYHQQTNQVLCSLAPRDWTDSGPRANLYGQDVNFGCCQANLHQGWPKFAQSLWGQNAGEIVSPAYAPSELKTTIDGVQLRIEQSTDYPFKDTVNFKIICESPVSFGWKLRVPAWCESVEVCVNDELLPTEQQDGWLQIEREWSDGDSLRLNFSASLRLEARDAGAISLHRGPLLFALPIEQEAVALGSPYTTDEPKAQEWEFLPRSDWNWALKLTPDSLREAELKQTAVNALMPFSNENAPITLQVQALSIQNWPMQNNSAAAPPVNPIPEGPARKIELIPYGCTRLRIAEFPVLE